MSNVRLTRRVAFSSGHRYWLGNNTEAENRRLFGRWASPFNHGHNYVLEATYEGPADAATGMVVNIKDIDELLQREIVETFDQRSFNDEVPHFKDRAPSLENIIRYIKDILDKHRMTAPDGKPIALTHLRLVETPTLFAELNITKGKPMTLTRSYEFAASHRLYNPAFDEIKNEDLYGKCRNLTGHGHNFKLEVTVEGNPNPETGMIVDIGALDAAVNKLVVDRYDHHNLNEDIPEFKGKVPTSEVVANEIWKALDGKLPARLHRIRLFETERNMFEVGRE